MIASIGEAVSPDVADTAPIIELNVPAPLPTLSSIIIPGLPAELQPDPGDVLLAKGVWPWDDLGAKLLPEQWLYMTRKVQGVIAQLSVQTPSGPRLVSANKDGSINTAVPAQLLPNLHFAGAGTQQIGRAHV